MNKRGKFIAIDGLDGAGKGCQVPVIIDFLRDKGVQVVPTREPGGTPLAEEIRALILSERHEKVSLEAETLLLCAARSQNVNNTVLPALESGAWVLSDRFSSTTMAFQAAGRGLDPDDARAMNEIATRGLVPDLTILLDVSVETSLERAIARGELDRVEGSNTREMLERIRSDFHRQAREDGQKVVLVDAEQSIERVASQVVQHLDRFVSALLNEVDCDVSP